MLKVLVVIDYIIFFAVIISSLFWLIDSNFSILLNFVLIYILISVLLIILGFEFLGILLLLLYSTGISIVFIIISMAVGTKHIDNEENDNVIDAYKNVTRAEADAFFVSSNNLTRNILLSVLVL
jgi:NADH:ubiquinone oxidoreductase subunit 6 (subunit J)